MGKNMWAKVVQRGILLREADQREALVLRNPDGTWELPGGKVEYGETAFDSLEREVREETGLSVTAAEPIETTVRKLKRKKKRGKFAVVYRCAFEGETVELSDEHVGFAWRDVGGLAETNLKQVDEYRSLQRVLTEPSTEPRWERPAIHAAGFGRRGEVTNGEETMREADET
ncbi:NUDIX domain-containing protein [Salinigranum halophilum]|uniref:NUDIX domain-containing protein n=1 Tax=Salinigranum halophilum TaxID=2565931 RepID=UPI0010A86067|nr:NUDIX domain-containing protein [Salinigranum halophilum]